jgi:hypothetical protein
MLTTVDNPFNPFTQYEQWYWWDYHAGYHTPGVLARQTISSNDLSEADQTSAINQAIDEIVQENVSGVHKKVTREDSS